MIDRKFRTDVVAGYAAQVATAACGLAFMALVTHGAGIATFGAIAVLAALATVVGNLLSFRTNEAVVAFCKRGELRGEPGQAKFALLAGVLLDVAVAGLLAGALYAAAEPVAALLLKDTSKAADVRLHAIAVFFAVVRGTPVAYWQATDRFTRINLLQLAEHGSKVAIVGACVLAGLTIDLRIAILAGLAPAVLASVVAYATLVHAFCTRLRGIALPAGRAMLREYAAFSASTFASSALKAGSQQLDVLVLGYLADARTVGIYGSFRQFLAPLSFLGASLASVGYPRFVAAVQTREHPLIRSTIQRLERNLVPVYAGIVVAVALAVAGYARVMDLDLAREHFFALALMTVTSLAIGRLWWTRPFSNAVDPHLSLRGNLIAAVFLVCALYPATHALGIVGPPVALAASALIQTLYWQHALAVRTARLPS